MGRGIVRLLAGLVFAALVSAGADGLTGGKIRFEDIAPTAGLNIPTTFGDTAKNTYILEPTGPGLAILDYDQDGDNDVFISNGTRFDLAAGDAPRAQLYRNDGRGKFTDVAASAGIDKTGWGQGVCVGDIDNDGDPDLYAAYFGGGALYRNNGDGTFRAVAGKLGLPADDGRWAAGCAFLDYNQDGRLDLFVSNYVDLELETTPKPGESHECRWKNLDVMCGPRGLPRAQNALYRNDGKRFRDVSKEAGVLTAEGRYGLGVVSADFDNDAWPDLYVASDMTPSLLYRNQGDGTFEEVGSISGTAFNVDGQLQAGMGVAVADFDGNGFLDLLKTNFSGDMPSLYANEDGVFFEDIALSAGLGVNQYLGWGALFTDVDEDGRPDILIANGHVYPEVDQSGLGETYRQPTLYYRNLGQGRFVDRTSESGPDLSKPRPARGMAAGDLDGDGRPEIVIVNMNAPPTLLRIVGPRRSWFSVELEGAKSNRSAIGARVEIVADGRTQMQNVIGGGSFFSQSAAALHFGLGDAERIDKLTVRWPSGGVQTFEGLAAGKRYRLREGGEPTEHE